MKKSFPLAALAIPCLVAFAGCRGFPDLRPDAGRTNAVSLSGAWEFRHPGEAWRAVEVPHDWAIEGPFDPNGDEDTGKLPWRGRGEYRRTFDIEGLDITETGEGVELEDGRIVTVLTAEQQSVLCKLVCHEIDDVKDVVDGRTANSPQDIAVAKAWKDNLERILRVLSI